MEAGHDFGGVTLVPAPPFEELLAPLQPGACGAVRANTAVVEDAEMLEAMGSAKHEGCRQIPACGGPGAADQRPICGAAARRDDARPGRREPVLLTMLILARSSSMPGSVSLASRSNAQHRLRRDRRSQRLKPATGAHTAIGVNGESRLRRTGSRTTCCRTVLSLSRPPGNGTACDGAVPFGLCRLVTRRWSLLLRAGSRLLRW